MFFLEVARRFSTGFMATVFVFASGLPTVSAPLSVSIPPSVLKGDYASGIAGAMRGPGRGAVPHLIPAGSVSLPPPPPPDSGGGPNVIDENNATKLGGGRAEQIVNRLEGADVLCNALPRPYRVDCLANQYERVSRGLPRGGEYRAIRNAFDNAARDLAAIAAQNVDPTAKRIRPRLSSGPVRAKATRPLNAVRPGNQSRAEAQAAVVIDELATVLLRSGENSAKRQIHYAKIAQAVESNKVLLRSAQFYPLDNVFRRHFG